MLGFALRRLGASLLLLYLVLTASFFFIHLAPGEPSRLYGDPRISAEQSQRLLELYGLDEPLGKRYLTWLGAVVRGEWGLSYVSGRPVVAVLGEKIPNTCLLAAGILVVEYGLGLTLGMLAAVRQGRRIDTAVRSLSLLFYAIPSFWLALLLIEVLTVRWPLFPTGQMSSDRADLLPPIERFLDLLHHLVLPAIALGVVRCGAVIRFVRNGLIEVLSQDYIRTAHAKGLSPARVLWRHALPNSLIPVVQRFGISLPLLLSGTVIMEVIFAWPGVGLTAYRAVLQRDYPLILACTAFSAGLVILGNLAADLLHARLDPRIRHA